MYRQMIPLIWLGRIAITILDNHGMNSHSRELIIITETWKKSEPNMSRRKAITMLENYGMKHHAKITICESIAFLSTIEKIIVI